MDAFRHPDAEPELEVLRARAYGPHPDIDDDPVARARLIELEAAHLSIPAPTHHIGSNLPPVADAVRTARANVVAVPDRADPGHDPPAGQATKGSEPDVVTPPHKAPWIRGLALAVGTTTGVVTVVFALAWFLGPHPDATQHPVPVETEFSIAEPLINHGVSPDVSTVRQYEPYRAIKLWSVMDERGYLCLAAFEQGLSGRFAYQCAPPGIDPLVDLERDPDDLYGFGEWLPEGSFVRLQLHGTGVDVYLPPAVEPE